MRDSEPGPTVVQEAPFLFTVRKSPQRPPQQYSAQPPATASVMSVAGGGHPQGGGGGQHAPQSKRVAVYITSLLWIESLKK